ncbi:MAG: DUF1822 family protein [Candidatus Gastranaerophilales bacterium]|nr:DUF1822 family protein [Candidatus Gastranaerophilales bacterium]
MGFLNKKSMVKKKFDSEFIKKIKESMPYVEDINTRKRIFVSCLGVSFVEEFLDKQKIASITNINMLQNPLISGQFDIADIYAEGARIDVRVSVGDDTSQMWIPRVHFDDQILPDFYIAIKVNSSFSEGEIIGFIETNGLITSLGNKNYYFVEYDALDEISGFKKTLKKFSNPSNVIYDDKERAHELFLSYLDDDISKGDKKFLLKVLSRSIDILRDFNELYCFDNKCLTIEKEEGQIDETLVLFTGDFPAQQEEISVDVSDDIVYLDELEEENDDDNFELVEEDDYGVKDVNVDKEILEYILEDLPEESIEDYENLGILQEESSSDFLEDLAENDDFLIASESSNLEDLSEFVVEEVSHQKEPEEDFDDSITSAIEPDENSLDDFLSDLSEEPAKKAVFSEETIKEPSLDDFIDEIEEEKPSLDKTEQIEPEDDLKPDFNLNIGNEKQENLEELFKIAKKESLSAEIAKNDKLKNIDPEVLKLLLNDEDDSIDFDDNYAQEKESKEVIKSIEPKMPVFVRNKIKNKQKSTNLLKKIKIDKKKATIAAALAATVGLTIGVTAILKKNPSVSYNPELAEKLNPQQVQTQSVENVTPEYTGSSNNLELPVTEINTSIDIPPPLPAAAQILPSKNIDEAIAKAFIPKEDAVNIKNISWEVSSKLASDIEFKKYLLMTGRALKLNLAQDLLMANDVAINSTIKIQVIIDKSGFVQEGRMILGSGSKQVDTIVLQTLKETFKYTKLPSIKEDINTIEAGLIINL